MQVEKAAKEAKSGLKEERQGTEKVIGVLSRDSDMASVRYSYYPTTSSRLRVCRGI
jgi:hypothetical protein